MKTKREIVREMQNRNSLEKQKAADLYSSDNESEGKPLVKTLLKVWIGALAFLGILAIIVIPGEIEKRDVFCIESYYITGFQKIKYLVELKVATKKK